MRPSLLIAITAAAALVAGQGLAQDDHASHHPAPAAASASTPPPASASAPTEAKPMMHGMGSMDSASMGEMCKGRTMDGKSSGGPGAGKSGMAMGRDGKPLTEAEIAKMHEQCAAMMSRPGEAPAKK